LEKKATETETETNKLKNNNNRNKKKNINNKRNKPLTKFLSYNILFPSPA
jgi:hypothetical protein